MPVNGNKSTSHRNAQGSNTAVNALILRVPVRHRSSLISKMYGFQNLKGWRTNDFKIVLPSASASSSSTIPSLGLRLIQSPHCSFLPFCLPYHLLLIRSRTVQQWSNKYDDAFSMLQTLGASCATAIAVWKSIYPPILPVEIRTLLITQILRMSNSELC